VLLLLLVLFELSSAVAFCDELLLLLEAELLLELLLDA